VTHFKTVLKLTGSSISRALNGREMKEDDHEEQLHKNGRPPTGDSRHTRTLQTHTHVECEECALSTKYSSNDGRARTTISPTHYLTSPTHLSTTIKMKSLFMRTPTIVPPPQFLLIFPPVPSQNLFPACFSFKIQYFAQARFRVGDRLIKVYHFLHTRRMWGVTSCCHHLTTLFLLFSKKVSPRTT
jgi:hypothetical protein